jgi:predicted nucleic acid-binding protein
MEICYLDTNVFLRFLTRDNPAQAKRAYALFQEVEHGTRQVTTADIVLAEVVYVLASKALYHLPRADIKAKLTTILSLTGFVLPGKRTWKRALELYAATTLDLADAYLAAISERSHDKTIISFDRDFKNLTGVTYREP